MSHLDDGFGGGGDDGNESPDAANGLRKKRIMRASAGDKSGKGLRHFSMKVCEKVESKGRTTYNEVADELVNEFSHAEALGMEHQFDEKNIRRRVYDALNVLMALDIIAKEKKEIQWKGFPYAMGGNSEHLEAERGRTRARMEKKMSYLQELQQQIAGLEQLVRRNEEQALAKGANQPTGGVALPFILVQTKPQATVEVEISEDMQLVHFDFNSTPFQLHDDSYVLRIMGLCEPQEETGAQTADEDGVEFHSPVNSAPVAPDSSERQS